jgi:hypothetical protein
MFGQHETIIEKHTPFGNEVIVDKTGPFGFGHTE